MAAGYAPVYAERALDEAGLDSVRRVLDRVLDGHEPYPAIVVDGDWTVVSANPSALWMVSEVAVHLLEPPVNAMRICLHPDGLAPAILNLAELRAHVLANLGRQAARTASPTLAELYDEVAAYPGGDGRDPGVGDGIAIPMRLRVGGDELSLISTIATFARAVDVTVAELAIESFYPADDATAQLLQGRS